MHQKVQLVELYGKSVWKVPAVLFSFGKSPPWFAEHSYEFFYCIGQKRESNFAEKMGNSTRADSV